MDAPHDLPGARACRAARVGLSVLAFVWASALAGCSSPATTLWQFGAVGTFSQDCSKPIGEGGARAIYEVPAMGGYPTFTAVNQFGTFRAEIERVDPVNAETLRMYLVHPDGAWDEIEMQKEGTGFRTTKMVVHKPNELRLLVTINAGQTVSVGDLVVERCSD